MKWNRSYLILVELSWLRIIINSRSWIIVIRNIWLLNLRLRSHRLVWCMMLINYRLTWYLRLSWDRLVWLRSNRLNWLRRLFFFTLFFNTKWANFTVFLSLKCLFSKTSHTYLMFTAIHFYFRIFWVRWRLSTIITHFDLFYLIF